MWLYIKCYRSLRLYMKCYGSLRLNIKCYRSLRLYMKCHRSLWLYMADIWNVTDHWDCVWLAYEISRIIVKVYGWHMKHHGSLWLIWNVTDLCDYMANILNITDYSFLKHLLGSYLHRLWWCKTWVESAKELGHLLKYFLKIKTLSVNHAMKLIKNFKMVPWTSKLKWHNK